MEADYTDSYTAIVKNSHRINAKELFNLMFVHHPKPIQYLFKLRKRVCQIAIYLMHPPSFYKLEIFKRSELIGFSSPYPIELILSSSHQ